jgi:hypothetical protein
LIALPLVGVLGKQLAPAEISGAPPSPYVDTPNAVGEGTFNVLHEAVSPTGSWETQEVAAETLGEDEDATYAQSSEEDARLSLTFNGQQAEVTYSLGPEGGILQVLLDGQPLLDEDTLQPFEIDTYQETLRYGVTSAFKAEEPGEHTLTLINTGRSNPTSSGTLMSISEIVVLPPLRTSNLGWIIAAILLVELVGLAFAALLGRPLFSRVAESLDTKRSILLALVVYAVIAVWGFFLDSVIEFWFLAWMVAMVQGGSQGLSRSLYASMSPSAKSGEFFGLYGIMEKFSAIFGPLVFAAAVATFGSSRPAVLSIIAFFILGGFLLTRVNVEEGRSAARKEDDSIYVAGT